MIGHDTAGAHEAKFFWICMPARASCTGVSVGCQFRSLPI
jgi:hypothetical protein